MATVTTKLNMTHEETAILNILQSGGKWTQRQLAKSEPFLNCHHHEVDSVPKSRQFETTLRKVRQIVRTLRITYKQPILSDKCGYWYSTNKDEATEILIRMERTAKAQSRSWHETYRSLQEVFHVKSEYFDRQLSLEL